MGLGLGLALGLGLGVGVGVGLGFGLAVGVSGGARVHEVAEELPTGGHLRASGLGLGLGLGLGSGSGPGSELGSGSGLGLGFGLCLQWLRFCTTTNTSFGLYCSPPMARHARRIAATWIHISTGLQPWYTGGCSLGTGGFRSGCMALQPWLHGVAAPARGGG